MYKTAAIAIFVLLFSIAEMKVVWEDNFDGGSIDGSKWSLEIGTGQGGWGNQELQYYQAENARIDNGRLIIEGRREDFEGSAFTSARMITKGKMDFKFGVLEARIKLPHNRKGLWPAFWTLGANIDEVSWPACGEIDVLEAGSADAIAQNAVNNQIGAAIHWGGDQNTVHKSDADLSADFHVYKLTWTDSSIKASIDDFEYFSADLPSDAFRKPHFVLLNLAIGGQYTGIQDPNQVDANFPAMLEVDYVRLSQNYGDELNLH